MIILTGYEGFIGKAFEKKLDPENLYRVGEGGADLFIEQYEDWDKVDLILHQGAISSTVETDLNKIHKYNVDFSIKLFEKAIEHQIPVKYASSASVYGTSNNREMNPLNYYAISKLQVDYWVRDNMDKFKSIPINLKKVKFITKKRLLCFYLSIKEASWKDILQKQVMTSLIIF